MTTYNIVKGVELLYVMESGKILLCKVIDILENDNISVAYSNQGIEYTDYNIKGRETLKDVKCYVILTTRLKNEQKYPLGKAVWIKDNYPCYTDTNLPIDVDDMENLSERYKI